MPQSELLQQIAKKETDKEEIAISVIQRPAALPEVLEGLGAKKARFKYGCAKVLRIISDKAPALLYPRFDFFADLLNSDNSFLKWDAIYIVANLASVDSEDRFESIFAKYFAPIPGPALITAANVIGGAAKIAWAKPDLAERVADELLKVEGAEYKTSECRNVALLQAIKSFDQFFDLIERKEPVMELIKAQLTNTRKRTRKAAEEFVARRGLAQ
ncbi:MAG TPA: hypothetical protein VMY98_03640 [Anaerolineae bacterium]|nr:hypothetical protein [Anaerolineae bacterium]